MFRPAILRQVVRAVDQSTRPAALVAGPHQFIRPLSTTVSRAQRDDKNDPLTKATTKAPGGAAGEHEGKYARTDENVVIEYPDDADMPRSPVVQGRGGMHFKRTLAQFSLENRVTLVTGGARVSPEVTVANSIPGDEAEESARKLVEQFQKENPGLEQLPNVTAHYADVSNPDSVNNALSEVIAKHGKIDHLVTSAGFTENFDAISYPYDRMQKLWGVNVDGTYLFATGVAKHLMERKAPGSIVMIGSMSGAIVNVPQPQAPYNAAKAAVRHLASSFAVEWAGHGIRVNCISPGYMLTALTRKILDENPELRDKWISLIPTGKMGVPEDLMGAVTFLLSDASKYITGADLRVDGGYTLT
ncbi:hypothetical protein AN4691.2 [Aspergillus nidulans FGSC A4]|uniref:Uncharacterized protein n=1 Tax=Emericella nidulans (strain FGSC A4 / ATCC 38163 / CBS 112.46 / NRRL 194 / M139) TaxID=227321 RepID=Q5B439_EMENI|nr:protein arbD [Aspergillus nidulans FGSC A4]EAA60733.1 hypothetical protein AN4691.2 [Aspergillus nidulans FGSC A4]CBF76990.1 TPA: D-arabinitol dehydrogenase (EC 1.1.1.250) [Source:UniProtKB/TrEMBL;Acc:Q6T5L8] [Aspergillus nidulans FGSC A4]|eukprot:XP_662295.1 hypothetical protein AN4691.2 [Aspergillus nidulans FGSC A4]